MTDTAAAQLAGAAADTRPLLEVRGLVAGYGQGDVLRHVDLTVLEASIVAVVGANGAGKSTLLGSLSGLVRTAGGSVVFDGQDLHSVPVEQRIRRGLVHVPEGRHVVPELTVEENLRVGGLWRGDSKELRRDIAEVYELFPALAGRRSSAGHQLSGGERQMLAIGRAVVAHPRLLMLDEPSLGLAPRIIADILALIARLRTERGIAVLLVEQNVRSALRIADVGVVLNLGSVITTQPAGELLADEGLRHAYLGF